MDETTKKLLNADLSQMTGDMLGDFLTAQALDNQEEMHQIANSLPPQNQELKQKSEQESETN